MVNLAEPILKLFKKSSVPEISVGDIVRVHQKIREGDKERIQVFEGIVIAKHGRTSLDSTFTVRKIASGVGVERVYLLHSPNIVKIEFKRGSQVRRAKLYYLRALSGKSLRMKDRKTNKVAWEEVLGGADDVQTEATETDIAEAVAAEEAKQEEMAATESTADDGATSSTEGTMETEVKASETNAEVSAVSQETHHEPTDAGGESAADQPAADDKPADADNRTVDSGDGA